MSSTEKQRREFQVDYLAYMKARLTDPNLADHVKKLYMGAVEGIERDLHTAPSPAEVDERLERRKLAGFQ